MDDDGLQYLRNINTKPGPDAGRSIDPTKPGPEPERKAQPLVTPVDRIADRLFELLDIDDTGPHSVLRFGERAGAQPYSDVLIDGNFNLNEIARKLHIFIAAQGGEW